MCRFTSTPQLPHGQLQAPSHLGATLIVTSLIMSLAQSWNRVLARVCENASGTMLQELHWRTQVYSTLIGRRSCLRTLHDPGCHHKHITQGIGLTSNHLLQHTKVSSRTYLASLLGSAHIHGSIPALSKPSSQRQAIVDDSTTGFVSCRQFKGVQRTSLHSVTLSIDPVERMRCQVFKNTNRSNTRSREICLYCCFAPR